MKFYSLDKFYFIYKLFESVELTISKSIKLSAHIGYNNFKISKFIFTLMITKVQNLKHQQFNINFKKVFSLKILLYSYLFHKSPRIPHSLRFILYISTTTNPNPHTDLSIINNICRLHINQVTLLQQ